MLLLKLEKEWEILKYTQDSFSPWYVLVIMTAVYVIRQLCPIIFLQLTNKVV